MKEILLELEKLGFQYEMVRQPDTVAVWWDDDGRDGSADLCIILDDHTCHIVYDMWENS